MSKNSAPQSKAPQSKTSQHFCYICATLLSVWIDREKQKTYFVCNSCTLQNDDRPWQWKIKSKISTDVKLVPLRKPPAVIVDSNVQQHQNITEHVCSKCHHDKAYFKAMQTRSGDEAMTEYYNCVQCGNVDKEE